VGADAATGKDWYCTGAKGWTICSITNGKRDTGVAGRSHRPRLAPMAANAENGTRNLTDAASHSQ
jgi:hypothetical protein